MKKSFIIYSFFCLLAAFSSCGKPRKNLAFAGGLHSSYIPDAADETRAPTQLWHPSTERLCILFGYGYNNEDFVKNMTAELEFRYGSYLNGGLILPLTFPDDFKRGGKAYISLLASILSEQELLGIVLLGAPDGTHRAIAQLQDSFGGELPCPVFSFFSQDDVIAMEDSADFVLDKLHMAERDSDDSQEHEPEFVKEIPLILKSAVHIIEMSRLPFEKNEELFGVVKKIVGDLKIIRYIDPATGLASINHFNLE